MKYKRLTGEERGRGREREGKREIEREAERQRQTDRQTCTYGQRQSETGRENRER